MQIGAIQITRDTLGGPGVDKVPPKLFLLLNSNFNNLGSTKSFL